MPRGLPRGFFTRFTPFQYGQLGWGWTTHKVKLANGFVSRFRCRFDPQGTGGADGLSFSVQNDGNDPATGEYGRGLGVSLNTFDNGFPEPSDNFVSVGTSSNYLAVVDLYSKGIHLKDAQVHDVIISHDGTKMNVVIDGIAVITDLVAPLASTLDANGYGWAGFGARTGAFLETQDVLSWQLYLSNPGSIPYALDPLPDSTLLGANMTVTYLYPDVSTQFASPAITPQAQPDRR